MSKNIQSFQDWDDEQTQNYLASHFPKGKMFGKIFNSNSIIYKFILSLSSAFKIIVGDIFTLVKNWDIDQTDELLEEWETSVKVPLEVARLDTVDKRRAAIKRLISKTPVYNIGEPVPESTSIENYLQILTGVDDLIVYTLATSAGATGSTTDNFFFIVELPIDVGEVNNFPFRFPMSFGAKAVPLSLSYTLNILLERIIPSFCRWQVTVKQNTQQKVTSDGLNKITSDGLLKVVVDDTV